MIDISVSAVFKKKLKGNGEPVVETTFTGSPEDVKKELTSFKEFIDKFDN